MKLTEKAGANACQPSCSGWPVSAEVEFVFLLAQLLVSASLRLPTQCNRFEAKLKMPIKRLTNYFVRGEAATVSVAGQLEETNTY